jgi:hypothetical protein
VITFPASTFHSTATGPQTGLDYEAEAALYGYFPPIRGGDHTLSLPCTPAHYSPPHFQAVQQATNDSEDEFFKFSPIRICPLFPPILCHSCPFHPQATQKGSQKPSLSSKEESSQLQHHQQPKMGLGRANIVNTVAVRPHTLYIEVAIADHKWLFIFVRPNPRLGNSRCY